jgi:tRNA nucleotidyltransferase (CCA-adding enzyme)
MQKTYGFLHIKKVISSSSTDHTKNGEGVQSILYNKQMQIILTHEQADFDAMGALLGAYLLDENAIPVLPRRVNRNVRAFLSLYGADLPFVEGRDLPAGPIDGVTLVDTQGLITLKGITRKTHIRVIDHHPPKPEISPDWQVTTEHLGACTTLFVESLLEHNGALNPVHATLLLLGIYEDTGSLTFAGTTPRDVRAVASLLEMGANLHTAGEFLNPPLSADQRLLYDRLLHGAESHLVNGQNIMLACGEAADLAEEVSSVAHKLRDLLDPDALFVIVSTSEGIRMVARSTTDRINVAEVTAHFGGGGHERAAAALIHPETLARNSSDESPLVQVHDELLKVLPQYVKPSINVGQIMSRRPLVIAPQTTIQKAAHLMQRYGYEGYPVVENGKVIGLLTRRAVDRAVAHKLTSPVASLMEAGEVTVVPQDSLERLQALMASSGWGQVPVVSPETGEVIGIVTRTDLLKTLSTSEAHLPGKQNLASRLEAAMPATRLALLKAVAETARQRKLAVYIVGGFVRDLILERPSQDFDVVVEGDAIALAHGLAEQYGGRVVSHTRFGTAKWCISDIHTRLAHSLTGSNSLDPAKLPESLDLIGARTEFYDYPTALPTVERSSIKLDLHRRDFTINTMALRLDGRHYGELYDYWGGLNDLHKGLVRVLHSLSFVDDPTRMLRAVRFEQRFGFQIEGRTRQLMNEARPLLRQVSGDRLRHEIDLALAEEKPFAMLARLQELELLVAIHPDLAWRNELTPILEAALVGIPDPAWKLPEKVGHTLLPRALAYLTWLGSLRQESSLAIADRLRLNGDIISALQSLFDTWQKLPELLGGPPSRVVAQLESTPVISLYALYLLYPIGEIRRLLQDYVLLWKNIQPETDGDALLALGVTPGPAYHHILNTLRGGWLDGKISTSEEEKALLQDLIKKYD